LLLALRTHAQERGLPLVVPLMDLDEQLKVTPAVVWSGTFDVLEQASQRYSADAMLIGRVSHDPAGTWTAAWEIRRRGGDHRFNMEWETPDDAGTAIVNRLTEELVARYAVASGDQQQLEIRVDGIANVADYGALLSYLAGLEFIDAVRIEEVSPNVVQLSL